MKDGSRYHLPTFPSLLVLFVLSICSTPYLEGSNISTRLNANLLEVEIGFEEQEYSLVQQNRYTYIVGDELVYPCAAGQPALPFKVVNVAIPKDIDPSSLRWEIVDERMIGNCLIAPVQPPRPLSQLEGQWVEGSLEIYGSDALYPAQPVAGVHTGFMGETKILSLAFVPFRWHPQTHELYCIQQIKVSVDMIRSHRIREIQRRNPVPVSMSEVSRRLVVNQQDIAIFDRGGWREESVGEELSSRLSRGTYEYVIVTADSLVSAFAPLVAWKAAKGLTATCVTTEWIDANYGGEDIQAKVRNFIRDAYQSWGTNWVLLGGDTNIIPSRTVYAMDCEMGGLAGNKIRCDLYFADLDGTWNANGVNPYGEVGDSVDMYPEVFVGRAPAENHAEAAIFVQKVITYEKNPPSGYALDMLMLGEILWTDPYTDAGIGLDMIDQDYIPDRFDPITKLYESKGNESRETALSAMTQGKNFVFHDGHCNEYVMGVGDGYIYYTDADTLSNGDRLLVINSIGCWPAAIDRDCIAEHFINNPNGGAVAFIGNSRYGWGSPGNPGLGYSDKFQHEFARAVFKDSLLHIGEAHASSKVVFVPFAQDENVYRWNEYQLNLLGDPEMALWTDEPHVMSLDLPEFVVPGGILRVEVRDQEGAISNACVTVTNGIDYYQAGLTDLSGSVVFQVETSSPESLLVTATSFNYRCATGRVGVQQPGMLPIWTELVISDSNDSLANPGETIEVKIGITNFGTQTIYGVNGVARGIRNCDVLDSLCYYGTLEPMSQTLPTSGLRIAIDSGLKNGQTVEIQLALEDSSSNSWVATIPVVVAAAVFEVASHGINDMLYGDGDLVVEPGEEIDLTIEIANRGLAAGEATVSMISLDPYLEVIDDVGSAGLVGSGSMGYSKHRISISQECPLVHIGLMEVRIGQPQYDFCDTVYLTVGDLSYFDDFSEGQGFWEHSGNPDMWFLTSNRFHSDSLSWYFGSSSNYKYPNNARGSLISPGLIAGEECRLSFWFWYDFTTYGSDGIYVILHRNSSRDTLDFIGSGGALGDSGQPLNVVSRWVRWERDLPVEPGDTVRIEFAFISDASGNAEGIYLDDFWISCKMPVIAGITDQSRGELGFEALPNPAGQSVEIRFGNRLCEAEIGIYDAQGRLVKKVRKSAGEPGLVWNLDNQMGHKVGSGVYFITVRSLEKPSAAWFSGKVVVTR